MFIKYFLPSYLVIYVLAAFGWRTYRVWKATGVNPVTFKNTDGAHDFIGRVFKLLFALIFIVIVVHTASDSYYRYFLPADWAAKEWQWIGIGLMCVSLVWTVAAQAQMGNSWRIGIDQENATKLVNAGIFSFSRNPIYVGMILTLAGMFLVIPNALTLLTLVLGVVLMGIQVRLEEEFLTRTQGSDYALYLKQVRRWFGRRAL